ncbi:FAD-binding protein [Rhodococcus spelaei]|uniref:FAD-binding protein n=1 Tax=Rhodococcus spelaei TaxID=2546320 RepID=A0A541B244_9NOCA|nr:FAD-dependent monooxygenase [Rhodococcus spelaei]TQF66381.1 FAD-binding protein [Rhodococcus spelaei]
MTSSVDPKVPHTSTDVLIVGAGPVGLTLALELRRRDVDVIVVDKLAERAPYAKAVGIQPRTLELWDAMGVARPALDAATTMRGQLVYVNGVRTATLELSLPDQVPYRFAALPQYETERVLADALAQRGVSARRELEFAGFDQHDDHVVSTIRGPHGRSTIASRYLVGCDGAHSAVRKGLGVGFEGDAFPEEYMLADVEVDWSMPTGFGVRSMHQSDGVTDDLLVCIPLPGDRRYRISMLVPDELSSAPTGSGEVAHGLEGGRAPELRHVQAVLDRLSPQPTMAHTMRWSSVFRISHRLAERYSAGRVFLAGDAAHIHPPTGAQGMNTGIQDAVNLGWKLALAVRGRAAEDLLESYHLERHPVGEEVVGRTVRQARRGIGADDTDPASVMAREAQLLVAYPDSPLVGEDVAGGSLDGGPLPGERAPDATELGQDTATFGTRLHELLRHPGHTLLLWATDQASWMRQRDVAAAVEERYGPEVRAYILTAAALPDASGITLRDNAGHFAAGYRPHGLCGYLIRPDSYVGYRSDAITVDGLDEHLAAVLCSRP